MVQALFLKSLNNYNLSNITIKGVDFSAPFLYIYKNLLIIVFYVEKNFIFCTFYILNLLKKHLKCVKILCTGGLWHQLEEN